MSHSGHVSVLFPWQIVVTVSGRLPRPLMSVGSQLAALQFCVILQEEHDLAQPDNAVVFRMAYEPAECIR